MRKSPPRYSHQATSTQKIRATFTAVVVLSCLALSCGLTAIGQSNVTIFGPQTFVRSDGKPQEQAATFVLPPAVGGPFKLIVENGSHDGTNRISSASVVLNGVEILGPSNFNQQVTAIQREVHILPSNVLKVDLKSAPGAYITVSVTGVFEIAPQPLPAGVSGPLIESLPPIAAVVGKPIQYQVIAESANPASLTFSLSASPTGMKIDGSTGLMQWTPTPEQIGDQPVIVAVQDSIGQNSQSFTLSVFGTRLVTSAVVSAASGGVISVDDPNSNINGLTINIPAGALAANTTLTLSELISPPTLGGTHRFLMKGFSVEPDGLSLALPAKITVPYKLSEFDTTESIPLEDFLGLYFIQTSSGSPQFLDSSLVDKLNHNVSVTVPHFSVYTVTNIARLCPPPTVASDCPNSYDPMWPAGLTPLVVVHGFNIGLSHASSMGDESTWGQLRHLMDQLNAGFLYRIDAWRFDWDSAYTPFETSAGNLANALQKVESLYGTNLVNIVAHSFGGILVRTYLEGKGASPYNQDVNRVMTLGTPHQGIGGDFANFIADGCAIAAQFFGQPKTCFEAGTGQQGFFAGLFGEGNFLRALNSVPLPPLQSPLQPQYEVIAGQRYSCASLVGCSNATQQTDDGLITTSGNKLCGGLNGSSVDVCSGAPVLEEIQPGLCHSGALMGVFGTCNSSANIPMAQIDDTSHPLWLKMCSFVGGCSLLGGWAGTATADFETLGGMETVPVSAVFTAGTNSIKATVVFTEPGGVPDVSNGSGTYSINGLNFSFDVATKDESVHVTGSFGMGPSGLVISGQGTSSSGDGGSGTVTPQIDGFNISGSLTVVKTDGNEQEGGSANLTMSPDGQHMMGTAKISDGTQVKWCLDKEGAPKLCP